MALTTQDFVHGVDFTGLPSVTGADLNNGIDLAVTKQESATIGKGLIIVTTDTALNIPDVPDAATHTKWKMYVWQRVPDPTATDLTPIHYVWSPNGASVVPYLQWVPIKADVTDLQTQITAIDVKADSALAQSAQAVTLAQSVNGIAVDAASNASAALAAADDALAAANAVTGVAQGAAATAATALTAANAAQATANGVVTDLSTYKAANYSCMLQETAGAGTDLGAIAAGNNLRSINLEQSDTHALVTLAGGKITITNAGSYEIDAFVPAYLTGDGGSIRATLVDDSDSSVLINGTCASHVRSGSNATTYNTTVVSSIKGKFVATAGMVVRINMRSDSTNGLLGKAANLGGTEVYTTLKLKGVV